jgi:hypothetical protein
MVRRNTDDTDGWREDRPARSVPSRLANVEFHRDRDVGMAEESLDDAQIARLTWRPQELPSSGLILKFHLWAAACWNVFGCGGFVPAGS